MGGTAEDTQDRGAHDRHVHGGPQDTGIPGDAMQSSDAVARYRAPALDKGLDILEVLAEQTGGLTRAEIVKIMGVSPSQIYRMLERLVARGYVYRDEGGDRYALTMKMFQLGTRHPPLRRIIAQAQPLMDAFAVEARQSCHLVIPEAGQGVIVAQASPPGHWEFRGRVGGILDLFTTGSGLTLLAFQHPDRLATTLRTWGIAEASDRLDPLAAHLRAVRAKGARIEPSSQLGGVTDISVPVMGHGDEAVAALTCAYIDHPDDPGGDERMLALRLLRSVAVQLQSP